MNTNRLPDDVPIEEVLAVYLDSARSALRQIRQGLDVPRKEDIAPSLPLIHRLAHNLKGASLQLGLPEIGDLAQAVERLSGHLQLRKIEREDHDLLKDAAERLWEQVKELASGGRVADWNGLCRRMEARLR
jgi:HPt (histidine-containing phosphotransfer) domain-containing protein